MFFTVYWISFALSLGLKKILEHVFLIKLTYNYMMHRVAQRWIDFFFNSLAFSGAVARV